MIERKLCGIYFRVKRNGKDQDLCFTDMTEDEQIDILRQQPSREFVVGLCLRLAQTVRTLGDEFDISADEQDGECE